MNHTRSLYKTLGLTGSSSESSSSSSDDSDDDMPHKRRAVIGNDGKVMSVKCDDISASIASHSSVPSSVSSSEKINICDHNSGNKPHKKFSIWSDILLEEQINDGLKSSMKMTSMDNHQDMRWKRNDRKSENYEFWMKKKNEAATSVSDSIVNDNDTKDNCQTQERNMKRKKRKTKRRRIRIRKIRMM